MSEKCKAKVYPKERWGSFHPHQCKKSVWKDGFCKIHHPETKKKRDEKRRLRWEQKRENSEYMRLKRAMDRIKELEDEIVKLKG